MNPRVITPPEEPFTLDQCRQHLRVEPYEYDSDGVGTHPDDWWILNVGLPAAREHCENFLGLSLSLRTLEYALNRFPSMDVDGSVAIELPMGPVLEVESVIIGDASSDSSVTSDGTLLFTNFHLDNFVLPSALWPVGGSWPAITGGRNAIRIRYTAGYRVDSFGGFELPKTLAAAILLVLGHLYEHREDTVEKALQSIPLGAEALMRPLRVRLGMA